MAEINDFNVTDASNTARWPEGMAPSAVNNAGRADEGILARWHKDTNGSVASTGSANAYVFAANQTLSAYYDGLEIVFDANFTNTGAATLNVDAVSAASIVLQNGDALEGGEILSGMKAHVLYDGTNWQLLNPVRQAVVYDQNDNELVKYTTTASAVNEITVTNAATGNDPSITATGDDTNIDLNLAGKGTGQVLLNGINPFRGTIDGLTFSMAADADHDMTLAVGICIDDNNSELLQLASALTKQIDAIFAEGNNAGGMFTGTVAADTTYHLILITKDADGTVDWGYDTSVTGANAPTGWTARRRLGSRLTQSAAANLIPTSQKGDIVYVQDLTDQDTTVTSVTTTTTPSTHTLNGVPSGVELRLYGTAFNTQSLNPSGVGVFDFDVTTLVSGNGVFDVYNNGNAQVNGEGTGRFEAWCNASAQVKMAIDTGDSDPTVFVRGWTDLRGKDA